MPLSKLSIFSKDTDANDTIKGYEYQKLRTLENWLINKVNNLDEVIYCEYEDDIFQRDINSGVSKFTQIKLYSSKSFSFKSVEITKAISNFFMLFVKGEYSFDTVQFLFETNTAIAEKYLDNDSELLNEWFGNQDNLGDDLLQRCSQKVKSIVTEYIEEEFPKVEKGKKSEAQSGRIEFNDLPESVWDDFAKSIKWLFTVEDSDVAVERVINSIKDSIRELPFPNVEGKIDIVFTTLYYEVSVKMFQNEPENRCLTNQKIDSLILDLGDEADKQYNIIFDAWKDVVEIKYFKLAEFLEVLHSANHCRQSHYLNDYSSFWLNLLNQFIQFPPTPDRYKQIGIYEFIWLSLRPNWNKEPDGTLIGQNHFIEQYFSYLKNFNNYESIENYLNLIQIVRVSILIGKCDLKIERTDEWLKEIGAIITEKTETVENPNELCYWLELQTVYITNPLGFDKVFEGFDKVFQIYYKLIELLPNAPLYNVTRLSDRISQYIKIYLQSEYAKEYIDSLENIADQLMPFVSTKNGNHILAIKYVDRGVNYLHATNPYHMAKALNYFHKAKDLWHQEETKEGYVLALLNISQLYSAIGMNFAAKYYALSAAWFAINTNPEKLAKRIASAFGLLVNCDYKQGAWFSALESFEYFVSLRFDFDGRPFDENDKLLMNSLVQVTSILLLSPKISTQLSGYIDLQKQNMGQLFSEFIEPLIVEYENYFSEHDFEKHIQDKLDAPPVNDIGPNRTIEWKAFGSIWSVSFSNTWLNNSLGEEFAAILQILLVELSGSLVDLHFIRTNVEIEIVESAEFKPPAQLPSNKSFKWQVCVMKVDAAARDSVRHQMAYLILSMQNILRDVSLLKDERFLEIFNELFQSEALAEKTLTDTLYQRIYRSLFTEDSFIESMRNKFDKDSMKIVLNENKIMEWNSNPSPLYSLQESFKQIEGRYKNAQNGTYLTIEHLKKQDGYSDWLKYIRDRKWLDWQILLSILNHTLTYKANRVAGQRKYNSADEEMAAIQKAFHEITQKDEKETFVPFPLDYFTGKEFQFQLDQTAFIVLRTWGLENKASFPNFQAMKDLLNHKFNFGDDDIPDLSPL